MKSAGSIRPMHSPGDSGHSAYGPNGHVASFGNHQPESLEEQRARLQQHAGKYDAHNPDDDDLGEHDWTVTYTDMVTLLMAFFVIMTAIAVAHRQDEESPSNPIQQEQVAGADIDGTGSSTFYDGRGFAINEGGSPANRDPVDSRYDDPEVEEPSTTDPSPSGEMATGLPPSAEPETLQSRPVPQPPAEPAPPPGDGFFPQPPRPEQSSQLAQQLQSMVTQNSLAGQVEVISAGDSVTLRISDKILFASGRANLENSGQDLVKKLSAILASSGGTISIEGHTDNIPISTAQFPSNWELSAARAAMVVRQLVDMGLPAERLRAIAYADTKPVGPNTSPEGRASNRRVELVISSTSRAASPGVSPP